MANNRTLKELAAPKVVSTLNKYVQGVHYSTTASDGKSGLTIPSTNNASDIVRSSRDMHPAHYTIKIDSFSFLLEMLKNTRAKNYESETFEAGGHKWKLSLYPNGDEERNGKDHLSLYLSIQETNALPTGWEVNANFKFFIFDQIRDKYLAIQDAGGKVRRFHEMKKEWGFAQLLPLDVFHDAAKGYLVQDKCTFGAEIFVHRYIGRGECLNSPEELTQKTYTWRIDHFSSLYENRYSSDVFTLGNVKWKLRLYPNRDKGKSHLSLYLVLAELETTTQVYAEFKLRIKNQKDDKHHEYPDNYFFRDVIAGWGFRDFLSLGDVADASNGFLVDDTLIVQAEITCISTLKSLS